ncbi:MAG TPA: OsmC family protein [Solirubrobacteraceae bacterium]|nr:OsmC family protein [Solirubrobacteraceae bacterium]
MSLETLINENRRAIETEPVKARAVFSVRGDLVGLTEVDLVARHHSVKVDEPDALGGEDLGANPVEHALIALASCQAITYRFWAAKLGIELEGLEITAEGDLDVRGFFGFDDGVRPGFTGVRLEITPAGPETAARYQELADAVDAHCPVLDLFTNETPVERRIAVAA